MEPSWSPIPPWSPGMLPGDQLGCMQRHCLGPCRSRAGDLPSRFLTCPSLHANRSLWWEAGGGIAAGRKARSPWKHAAKLGEPLLPLKRSVNSSDHRMRMNCRERGAEGMHGPAHRPQKMSEMRWGDSSRRSRSDAQLQESFWGRAVRMLRTKCSGTRRPGWEQHSDATSLAGSTGSRQAAHGPAAKHSASCPGHSQALGKVPPAPGVGTHASPELGGMDCAPQPSPTLLMHP